MRSLGNWVSIYNNWQALGKWRPGHAPQFFNVPRWGLKWPAKPGCLFRGSDFWCLFFNGHDSGTDWLEVPTIYKAYISGLCKGISPQDMDKNMVLTYLHVLDPEIPMDFLCLWSVGCWRHMTPNRSLSFHGRGSWNSLSSLTRRWLGKWIGPFFASLKMGQECPRLQIESKPYSSGANHRSLPESYYWWKELDTSGWNILDFPWDHVPDESHSPFSP